jgi:preprotein translocase subunit YajC
MTLTSPLFLSTLILAQNTSQPATPANPSMVGLPEGSQQAPAPGTTQQPVGPAPGAQPSSPFGGMQLLLPLILMFGIMIVMQVFTGRKEKRRRQEMLSSMKKGDRVQTAGGIIGTIAEIHEDDMILRLEEGRMRVARSSVQGIVKEARAKADDQAPEVVVKQGREKAQV